MKRTFATGSFLSIFMMINCGGQVVDSRSALDDGSPPDAGTPDDDASTANGFDAGAGFDASDVGPAIPPVANGPTDTAPACASRPVLDCGCDGGNCTKPPAAYFSEIILDCQSAGSACGFIYADFDADGCATALRLDDPDPKLVACVTERLDENIWSCELGGGEISKFLDCTIH